MHRARFLAGVTALSFTPIVTRAQQEEYDPAVSSTSQALRVLLGRGDAQALPGGGFTFEGRAYRGTFVREPDGSIVSTVPLEEYLYSVVPREMPPSWPAPALQAQAVCARTYVLQRSSPRRNYDLVPSEADQVYGGIQSESPGARAAVDATAMQVLRFESGFAQIMYSSCCGGHTEASADAWGGTFFPYLAGVVCTHCTDSPNYRWKRDVTFAQIVSAFATETAPFGAITGLRANDIDGSGRLRAIELDCQHGSTTVKGSVFRARIGARNVPSLLITKFDAVPPSPDRVTIEGGGLGHGVGLCQWGARGMALEGATSSDILNFYFPGTTIGHD